MKHSTQQTDWPPSEEEQRVHKLLARDFSASRMSSTKWREAIAALSAIPVKIAVKFVDAQEALTIQFSPRPVDDNYVDSGNGHIFLLSIEWLEVFPVEEVRAGVAMQRKQVSHSAEVESRLQKINVPYQWEGENIRIVGHLWNR